MKTLIVRKELTKVEIYEARISAEDFELLKKECGLEDISLEEVIEAYNNGSDNEDVNYLLSYIKDSVSDITYNTEPIDVCYEDCEYYEMVLRDEE